MYQCMTSEKKRRCIQDLKVHDMRLSNPRHPWLRPATRDAFNAMLEHHAARHATYRARIPGTWPLFAISFGCCAGKVAHCKSRRRRQRQNGSSGVSLCHNLHRNFDLARALPQHVERCNPQSPFSNNRIKGGGFGCMRMVIINHQTFKKTKKQKKKPTFHAC